MAQIYLGFDSETGGIDPKTSDMLTAYFGFFDENFKLIDEIDFKLKPDDGRLPIAEAGALKVNGIDLQAHMADPNTITYSQAREKLIEKFKIHLKKNGRYSNIIPLGHNIPFDQEYVWQYLMPKTEWQKYVHYRMVDTMPVVNFLKMCSLLPPELGPLESIVEHFGVPKRDLHNAKGDTLMTVDVCKALIDLLKSRRGSTSGPEQDLISLLEAE